MNTVIELGSELGYLTYFSSAMRRFSQNDLRQLLEISRRKNTPNGITGMLLYRDGHFLQYLEGPAEQLKTTYDRIARDIRHDSPRIVGSGQLRRRIFPEWSMGYKNLAGIRAANTAGYSECFQPNFRPSPEGDPAARLTNLFYDLTARSVLV